MPLIRSALGLAIVRGGLKEASRGVLALQGGPRDSSQRGGRLVRHFAGARAQRGPLETSDQGKATGRNGDLDTLQYG